MIKLADEIELLVEKLQLKHAHFKNNPNELWALCPYHHDTIADNFSINLTNGKVNCFSCKIGGSLIQLAFDKKLDYSEAFSLWVKVKRDEVKQDTFLELEPADKWLVRSYEKSFSMKAIERVQDIELLRLFDVYSDKEDNIVYFIRDADQDVRSILVKYDNRDIPIYNGHWKKQGLLGGVHLPQTELTVLVEGVWDALHIYKSLGLQSFYFGGSSITTAQISYLMNSDQKYCVMTDGDDAGRSFRDLIHWSISRYENCHNFTFAGKYNCDPDEMNGDKLEEIINNAKSWNDYEIYRKTKHN